LRETKRETVDEFAFESNDPRAVENAMRHWWGQVAVGRDARVWLTEIGRRIVMNARQHRYQVEARNLVVGSDVRAVARLKFAPAWH
jgi:hypothetical protein